MNWSYVIEGLAVIGLVVMLAEVVGWLCGAGHPYDAYMDTYDSSPAARRLK